MRIAQKHVVSIGTGLMSSFGIGYTGLVSSWEKAEKKAEENKDDVLVPNDSTAGTPAEHKQFCNAIPPFLKENQAIPKNAFCTMPEAVVHLPTPEGEHVFRQQYRIPYAQYPVIEKAVQQWLENGTIKEVPPDVKYKKWNTVAGFIFQAFLAHSFLSTAEDAAPVSMSADNFPFCMVMGEKSNEYVSLCRQVLPF